MNGWRRRQSEHGDGRRAELKTPRVERPLPLSSGLPFSCWPSLSPSTLPAFSPSSLITVADTRLLPPSPVLAPSTLRPSFLPPSVNSAFSLRVVSLPQRRKQPSRNPVAPSLCTAPRCWPSYPCPTSTSSIDRFSFLLLSPSPHLIIPVHESCSLNLTSSLSPLQPGRPTMAPTSVPSSFSATIRTC